jgi:hypothetical protein
MAFINQVCSRGTMTFPIVYLIFYVSEQLGATFRLADVIDISDGTDLNGLAANNKFVSWRFRKLKTLVSYVDWPTVPQQRNPSLPTTENHNCKKTVGYEKTKRCYKAVKRNY